MSLSFGNYLNCLLIFGLSNNLLIVTGLRGFRPGLSAVQSQKVARGLKFRI